MKFKKFTKIKLFFFIPLLAAPVLLMASCSSNQVSQFGNYASINFKPASPYGSDAFQYDPLSGTFVKNGIAVASSTEKTFLPFFTFIEQCRLYTDKLIALSHSDPNSSDVNFNNGTYSNKIFSESLSSNLLHEFLLASANNLNQGSSSYKLSVSEINLSSKSTIPLFPTKDTDNLDVDPDDKELKTLYYNNNIVDPVSIEFIYKYYDSSSDNLGRAPVTDINLLNNYLASNKSWGPNSGMENYKVTRDSYKIQFNLNFYVRSVYKTTKEITAGTKTTPFDKDKDTFNALQFCLYPTIASPVGEFLKLFPIPTIFRDDKTVSSDSSFAKYFAQLNNSLSSVNPISQLDVFQSTIKLS